MKKGGNFKIIFGRSYIVLALVQFESPTLNWHECTICYIFRHFDIKNFRNLQALIELPTRNFEFIWFMSIREAFVNLLMPIFLLTTFFQTISSFYIFWPNTEMRKLTVPYMKYCILLINYVIYWFIWYRQWIYYSKVSNKRTVFNNRTGGDIILQKV